MSRWVMFLTWLGIAKQESKSRPMWFYTVHPLDTDPVLWIPTITNAKYTQRFTLNVKRSELAAEKVAKKEILRRGGTPRKYESAG